MTKIEDEVVKKIEAGFSYVKAEQIHKAIIDKASDEIVNKFIGNYNFESLKSEISQSIRELLESEDFKGKIAGEMEKSVLEAAKERFDSYLSRY